MSTSVTCVSKNGDSSSIGLLQSITVTQPPAKTEYYQNDILDLAGIEVTATYLSEGPIYSTKVVTSQCTYSPNTGDTLSVDGIQTINISFTEGSASVSTITTVNVKPFIVPWSTGTNEQIAKMLEAHYEGKIDVTDHWAIGDERPVELTTGETVQMVLMHQGQYPLADMVDTLVGQLSVGTAIQLNENGSPVDYIVVHQGKPSDMYDESCNGTWVLRKDILENRKWDATNNDYQNSDIHEYLNGEFLNRFDENTKTAIKQVKIPYVNGTGSGGSVASGVNGLSCKLFLLSGYEVGFTKSDSSYFPADGARLAYFTDANKRIAYLNGAAGNWWLRSPSTAGTSGVWYVGADGGWSAWGCDGSGGVRPALVLDSNYTVKKQPTCAFVVGMKDCLNAKHQMNSSSTNAGGWNGCKMRTYLNSTVYNQLPDSIKQILKKMNVWTANGGNQSGTTGVYSEDYLALPAEKEVFGSNTYADSSIESQLFQFDWYKIAANRIKKVNGRNDWWWERSPFRSMVANFCGVDSAGGAGRDYASSSYGVSFFGCI